MTFPPLSRSSGENLPEFDHAQFERFRQLVQEKCGLFFDESKLAVVRNVVQERMVAQGLADYEDYYQQLTTPSQTGTLTPPDASQPPTGQRVLSRELRRLVEKLAVNETSFLRNREHYRAISEEVLPRLLRRHADTKRLRIWSAACSTGQEPYSLAITLLEVFQQQGLPVNQWTIEIVATDISERALRMAHAGRYRSDEMRGLTQQQTERYFRPLSGPAVVTAPLDPAEIYKPGRSQLNRYRSRAAFEVSPQVRQLVDFQFLNLVLAPYPADKFHSFDLVLCENVTIYFPPEVTRQVIQNIYNTMNDGAFLFIGYSETLWQVSDRFKLINTQDTFYYQKPYPNEDPSRYVRRAPATGPLSAEVLEKHTTTDKLRYQRPASLPEPPKPGRKTDPLSNVPKPVKLPAERPPVGPVAHLPVIGGNRPRYLLTDNTSHSKAGEAPKPAKASASSNWRELLLTGKQHMAEHEFDKALEKLEQAQAAGPDEVDVLCAMAELKLKLGYYDTAAMLCQRAIEINRLSEAAHLMLAMIYHKEGRIEQAVQEYKYTIYINLDAVIAYMRLADIYRDTGHQRDALREYKRALAVLQQKAPDEIIEDLSVGLLIQACQQNITRLTPRQSR